MFYALAEYCCDKLFKSVKHFAIIAFSCKKEENNHKNSPFAAVR